MPKPKKQFAKIYIEITNVCNLDCSFCHGTKRRPCTISAEDFELYAKKIADFTDHVYLHVMGEPLLHPELERLIGIAHKMGLKSSITTNGTLLKKQLPMLVKNADKLYKISISLHSLEANSGVDENEYLDTCLNAARELGRVGIITVLRLWNLDGLSSSAAQNLKNDEILEKLKRKFDGEWCTTRSGQRLENKVYLEWGEKFDWPDMSATDYGDEGYCYALKDHVAVLSDGSVVPCCLDADCEIKLGNLKEQELGEILSQEKAKLIAHGFANRKLVHPLCKHCGFARKF